MGKKVKTWVTFTKEDQNKSYSKFILKCLNQPHKEKFSVVPDCWLGQQCMVRVIQETREYEGKTYTNAKVKGWRVLEETGATGKAEVEDDPFKT